MAVAGAKPDLVSQRTEASHRTLPIAEGTGDGAIDRPAMSPEATEVWEQLVPPLESGNFLIQSDSAMLAHLCETLAMAEEYRKQLYATIMDPEAAQYDPGSPEEKRLRSGYVELVRLANSIASEHGISPTARVRFGMAKIKGNSLLDAMARRHDADAG